ncbi:translation elongation factor 4 [Fructobacillus papyrifericola]|uniref:Elongation factor 4 n=1 Tax=Fructobacillus papyrifericola TaxID=2713172 RepID=A0ABS5QST5_9LACO|nr:translation elongation factor 4 [Fructobacillus papyrifericola]MBS9336258.1 elongation factor 4 [Fructobacillus papyrifericola]
MQEKYIRNFAIISHIDHGKSTLSDRLMELTGTVSKREMAPQLLDSLSVEQAHGVTVKSRTVQLQYRAKDGQNYRLNLIDTPGHVDFAYEVSKSLAATDGVLLLVDATQGVQAQTVANWRLAHDLGLPMIPVINKVDSAQADVDRVYDELMALDSTLLSKTIYQVSAKTGQGVPELLEGIVKELPSPKGDSNRPLKALVYDSEYDAYLGVITQIRVVDGQLNAGQTLRFMATNKSFQPKEVGVYRPDRTKTNQLSAGEVGYVVTGLKEPKFVKIGDTLTSASKGCQEAVSGFQERQPVVYAGIFPKDDYLSLKEALLKIELNDSALTIAEEHSAALGPGFRVGFLGVFHLQIIQERLASEYGIEVIVTAPNVSYQVRQVQEKEAITVTNPAEFPSFEKIESVEEPIVLGIIDTPGDYLDAVMKLAERYRGTFADLVDQAGGVRLSYRLPLAEIAYDFFNQLKSITHGYASLQTKAIGFEESDLVKVDVQVNYAKVDALAFVTHRSKAAALTQKVVHELKMTIPRRLYPMPVQALVEGKVLARVDVPPLRKNAAVNGEQRSVSKKQALLRRQNVNKRSAAHLDIVLPQEVFNALLSLNE